MEPDVHAPLTHGSKRIDSPDVSALARAQRPTIERNLPSPCGQGVNRTRSIFKGDLKNPGSTAIRRPQRAIRPANLPTNRTAIALCGKRILNRVISQSRNRKHLGDKKLLLFVAVDWPHENHQILIAAAKLLLHTKALPFELIFTGHRRTGLLSRLIQESGVGHVVKDLGTQTTSTVAAHYAALTIVLFPSKCEGFGIPLVEAMQYGKPIRAGTHKCIQEVGGASPD